MPHRTKKEKILAERRRTDPSFSSPSPSFWLPSALPPLPHEPKKTQAPSSTIAEFPAIRRDIAKTILLGIAAIAFEMGMYWYTVIAH